MHSVACPATRPSWLGTSESRWFHAIGIQLLHVLQLRRTIEVKHIGKSMVPCHRSPLRGQGTLESRWLHSTCIQPVAFPSLGLTIVVRHSLTSCPIAHAVLNSLNGSTQRECVCVNTSKVQVVRQPCATPWTTRSKPSTKLSLVAKLFVSLCDHWCKVARDQHLGFTFTRLHPHVAVAHGTVVSLPSAQTNASGERLDLRDHRRHHPNWKHDTP